MTRPSIKLITTEDGSHSLLREDLNETYHSFHGAKRESLHVFIQHGIKYVLKNFPDRKKISVFEVGFGTGLNAFLTALLAEEAGIDIHFYSIEPIPVPEEIYSQLNFGTTKEEKQLLRKIHSSEWEDPVQLTRHFQLIKMETTLESIEPADICKSSGKFEVLFFDAFAPSRQPHIWSIDNLKKCYDLLTDGGILTTYCAQGLFKRNLSAAGFEVETLKGAMGKKEMVRGMKDER